MEYNKWTLNNKMIEQRAIDWQRQAAEESRLRHKTEQQVAQLSQELEQTTHKLQHAEHYAEYLRGKLDELETTCAHNASKLRRAIEVLQKAKTLLLRRKQTVADLQTKNQALTESLAKQSDLLAQKIQCHQQVNAQLAQAYTELQHYQRQRYAPLALLHDLRSATMSQEIIINCNEHGDNQVMDVIDIAPEDTR